MDDVSIKDFQKLDIRIGTILEAEVPKWSHWVMKMTVDVGSIEGDPSTPSGRSGRQKNTIVVFAGIMHFYKPVDLIGKQFPFIVNLEPKKIGPEGDISCGMMLMAVKELKMPFKVIDPASAESFSEAKDKPVLFYLSEKVENGTRVQ